MAEQRSIIAFGYYHESEQRFEYFITGISTALCAYVGQTLKPQEFGFNSYTLEVASVVLIVTSIIFGFRRIQLGIHLNFLNHSMLHMGEVRGTLMSMQQGGVNKLSGEVLTATDVANQIAAINKDLPAAETAIKTTQTKTARYYNYRNVFLLFGFIGLFASKILAPYLH
jgi:hypothetical protein